MTGCDQKWVFLLTISGWATLIYKLFFLLGLSSYYISPYIYFLIYIIDRYLFTLPKKHQLSPLLLLHFLTSMSIFCSHFCLLFFLLYSVDFNSVIVILLYFMHLSLQLVLLLFLAFYLLMVFYFCFIEAMYYSSLLFTSNNFLIVSSGFYRRTLFWKYAFPLRLF